MIAQISLLCASLVVVSATSALYGTTFVNTGASTSSRHQDSHGNYAFGYDIVDGKGASNSRSEVGDAYGNKKGYYTLHDIDGRARRVDYVADGHGFRAAVRTNEPGTAHSSPADVLISSPYAGPQAPVTSVTHIAPVAVGHKAPPAVVKVAPVSYTTKSVVSHAIPAATIPQSGPVAIPYSSHVGYSTKSVASHAAPIPNVSYITPVAVNDATPLAYSTKSAISHAATIRNVAPSAFSRFPVAHTVPISYSRKSLLSHKPSRVRIAHASQPTLSQGIPTAYIPKSVISHAVPVTSYTSSMPITISNHGLAYNKGLGLRNFGYSHGLLGYRLGGIAYPNNIYYDHKLLKHGVPRYFYNRGIYGNGFLGHQPRGISYNNAIYDHGLFGHRFNGLTYGRGIYGGVKSIYY